MAFMCAAGKNLQFRYQWQDIPCKNGILYCIILSLRLIERSFVSEKVTYVNFYW